MANELNIGIDYSLEKLTVVVSDCGKRPVYIFQALMHSNQKNKIKHYRIEVRHYKVGGQFENFKIEEIHFVAREMSIGKIHFHRRLAVMSEELNKFLEMFPRDEIKRIAMEAYSKFSRNDPFITGEGYGSLKTLLHLYGYELDYFIPPSRLKKLVLGSGDLDKDAILYLLETNHGYRFLNDDMADAYLLSVLSFFAKEDDLIPKIQF